MNEKAAAAEIEFLSTTIIKAEGDQKTWLIDLLKRFKEFSTGPKLLTEGK